MFIEERKEKQGGREGKKEGRQVSFYSYLIDGKFLIS